MTENDELRLLFKARYPDLKAITQAEIHRLLWLLDVELDKHSKAGNLEMNMIPLNNFVAKMIREKGIEYKGLNLMVRAHYFECGRQAISFDKNGGVWFCGWAGGNNPEPFLRAFRKWLEPVKQDWARGYFCSVANRIKGEGTVDQLSRELFKAGGDWTQADDEDIAVFQQHGLIREVNHET